MRRVIALVLVTSMIVCGCASVSSNEEVSVSTGVISTSRETVQTTEAYTTVIETEEPSIETETSLEKTTTEFVTEIDEETVANEKLEMIGSELADYVQTEVNDKLTELGADTYSITEISATYYERSYLDELEFNSKENIFFGYKLSELDEQYKGKKYIFTLGDDGTTVTKEFEEYSDEMPLIISSAVIGGDAMLLNVTAEVKTENGIEQIVTQYIIPIAEEILYREFVETILPAIMNWIVTQLTKLENIPAIVEYVCPFIEKYGVQIVLAIIPK